MVLLSVTTKKKTSDNYGTIIIILLGYCFVSNSTLNKIPPSYRKLLLNMKFDQD